MTNPPLRAVQNHLSPLLNTAVEDRVSGAGALTEALLRDARRERATDIHLDPTEGPLLVRFRIDSVLHDVARVPRALGERLVNHFKTLGGLSTETLFHTEDARANVEIDGADIDMRLGFAPSVHGTKIAIRLLEARRIERKLHELGLSDGDHRRIIEWLERSAGAFLVTGPAGSGKTTTLYALLREVRTRPVSIVTIEDPVEFHLDGVTQIEVDEDHDLTLASGLKGMLRLDPDYLLLSEIRDAESAQIAIEAGSSGRALLSTLHTRSAAATLTALRNYDLEDYEISTTLEMVVAQRLVRRLCPSCKRKMGPTEAHKAWLDAFGLDTPKSIWVGDGCADCQSLGCKGRVGIFEIWRLGDDDYQAILDGIDERSLRRMLCERGHRTLLDDGLAKVAEGEIALDELMSMMAPPYKHGPA